MIDSLLDFTQRTHAATTSFVIAAASDLHEPDDRGEGVISAAIAVLIMAFLGAAMWIAFKVLFDDVSGTAADQVDTIGS